MMSKDNYTIVITGATKGLGRALAEQYIQLGHMVIGCGRSFNSIKLMSNSYKYNTDFQVVDISNHKQVRSWAKYVLIKFGPPDFLLNNAGIINKHMAPIPNLIISYSTFNLFLLRKLIW